MTSRLLSSNDAKSVDNKHTIRRVKIFYVLLGGDARLLKQKVISTNFGTFNAFAGCVAFDSAVDPRAELQAYPLYIQEGETITLDARTSERWKE